MKTKIHKRFIIEANRIRIDYLKEIEILTSKEVKINSFKQRINEIMLNIEKYVKNNQDSDEEQISKDLSDELSDIEISMNLIKKDIGQLNTKIERLNKQSGSLYKAISEKHPNLTEKEIQEEILYSLKK